MIRTDLNGDYDELNAIVSIKKRPYEDMNRQLITSHINRNVHSSNNCEYTLVRG